MGTRVPTAALATLLLAGAAAPLVAQAEGKALYDRWCAGCHGPEGRGDGPGAATMLPRPRNFTLALYQVRTTATGEIPTDDDILRVIDEGMPGTTMPGWRDALTRDQRLALVAYLKTFSHFFQGDPPQPLDLGRAPRGSHERLARGREAYESTECWRCHGQAGRGDGASAPTLEDDLGWPIRAADLTANWTFNAGGTVSDIYRTLRTGMDGTPMPSFSDMVDAGVITDDDLWSLAHFVRSLSPERTPPVQEVVRAVRLTDAPLPATVDDELWEDVEAFRVPLVGQIVLPPRWFAPRVESVWVQAVHDGADLVLRISWTDPSRSPDPEWAGFAARMVEVMGPGDPGSATTVGAPDRLTVQFPAALAKGLERPYFLHGDPRRPTYLWTWRSDGAGAVEHDARGMGTAVPQPDGEQHLHAEAVHADGQWRLLLRRSLDTGGEGDLAFPVGQAVPMAFQAWDGDNGEDGLQGSVSTWYFLFLEEPARVAVYVAPPVALVLTFLFGLLVIRQARREEGGEGLAPMSGEGAGLRATM